MANLVHAAQRKAFSVVLDNVMKKAEKSRGEGYVEVINYMQKLMGDTWPDSAYDKLRNTFSKGGKYAQFFDRILENTDTAFIKGLFMSIGFEAAFTGYRKVKANEKKYGCHLPWLIIFDPTSACNLKCIGCWAAEYGYKSSLTWEQMDDLVTQGKELGIHAYIMTGGEPTVRKRDIVKLAKKHYDCAFMLFTNGTLVDQEFCDGMRESKNIILSMSIEGDEEATDSRRGKGTFQKIMNAMNLLHENGLVYGTSICYTSANYKAVTSDEFIDFLIDKGVTFSWYFHYMPIGNDADVSLLLNPEQREYMYNRIREIRGWEGGKQLFCMDFQNDGQFVHGCIAGGKHYCHINSNGDVEPCVFVHYSTANIKEKPLIDCLRQPLFMKYQQAQPFNENMLQPCPMLENPEILREIVKQSGAKSTDMISPESVDHLCDKCEQYAKDWDPVADRLWKQGHPDYVPSEKSRVEELVKES
ncbi:MAG: radical SAM protein [Lachnospiraceae bacterium]|nr:radical SAM protein [Lachnospiraceae bacterium]